MEKQAVSRGDILISEPFLGDANFERSVVLMCEHNESGSFGFVLNQKTELNLKDVLDESCFAEFPVYIGGPVERDTLHFIHRREDLITGGIPIDEGLLWGGDYEEAIHLANLGKIREEEIRFFAGYSGWGSGQLDGELQEEAWIVSRVQAEFLFVNDPEQLWRSVLKNMGGKHKALSNYPIDPRLN